MNKLFIILISVYSAFRGHPVPPHFIYTMLCPSVLLSVDVLYMYIEEKEASFFNPYIVLFWVFFLDEIDGKVFYRF